MGEAIQHMIIRKNFGATHFIIGRDMAGTWGTLTSDDFYGAFEAQEMGKKHSAELEMTVVDYPTWFTSARNMGMRAVTLPTRPRKRRASRSQSFLALSSASASV